MKHLFSACFLLFSLGIFAQQVNLTLAKGATLKEIFGKIEQQTDYKFAFTDQIDLTQKYTGENISLKGATIKQVLDVLGKNLPFKFDTIGNNITVKRTGTGAKKQGSYILSGTVLDDKQETVVAASIHIVETDAWISTDENGRFSATLPAGDYTLETSYIGLAKHSQKVSLSKNTNISIGMREDAETLDELVIAQNTKAVDIRKPQMSVNSLTTAEIKQIPVAMGEPDVLKSLMTLPGVTNAGELSSGINVRGGAADQNLVLLDNTPIYSDSHMFGFFSVFNADAVKSLDLYKGGIPSKFGGRVSSILDVHQQPGINDSLRFNGGIGLISSKLLVEGPVQRDKSSFMVAGRTSYAHLFLKLADNNNSAMFYDINARFNQKINDNNSLHFSGYLGSDVFDIGNNFTSSYGNAMATLNWKHSFSDNLKTALQVFYSDYKFKVGIDSEGLDWDSGIATYGLKYDWLHKLGEKTSLNYGIETTYYDFNPGTLRPLREDSQFNYQQFQKKHALEPSAYLDIEQEITEKLNLRYGVRYSMFYRFGQEEVNIYQNNNPVLYNPTFGIYEEADPIGTLSYGRGDKIASFDNFEPRAALSYTINDDQSVKASYNRMAQYLHIIANTQSPLPMNIWTPSGPHIKPQLLDQYALGYFRNFNNKEYSLETEVFYKTIQNRIDYVDGADIFANEKIETVLLNGKARSYGLEVLFRKNTGVFTGWVSYTLSRAEQKTAGRTPEEPGVANGDWYLSAHDKLHNLNITGNYDYNPKWSFSANFTLQSGRPVTFPNGYFDFGGIQVPNYSERNKDRLPAYHHLDVAATYTPKPDKKKGWQSQWVFSIYNLYGRKNAASISFGANEDTGVNEATRLSIFGIIPSVSYNFKF
ncbi:collagen-binding protein [Flavobacterium akiainvivens]|uniref:Collagen-binding protein n=1 Tax=Flavobacterium akiainvivens TaxID=1202724 RepID=A0A0M8MHH3_9FLAO|nr:carboxypeptidase-like regulatory domain-containing protein [Flavobacterium akiainvivens]KOS05698.1 collagen-binding protein [Flavobacterium akiainvivens]SFQ36873.1 TonB-dependent Receptor Plug Domain [Flavobacterium akiainvivens]